MNRTLEDPPLSLDIRADDDDDLRALYQAILRAVAAERTETNRLRTLRATGYGKGSTDQLQSEWVRAEARQRMLSRLLDVAGDEMAAEGVKPW